MTNRTPERQVYRGMLDRCTNSRNKQFKDYGGRGITVCDRWRESFENFLADMGERPDGLTLERKDNNGNYEPGNCVWATYTEQARNRRNNVWVEFGGSRMTVSEAIVRAGLKPTQSPLTYKLTAIEMQAAILAALEPAKQAHFEGKLHYRGGGGMWARVDREQRPWSVITFRGQDRDLPADAYDLRATLAYLSRTTPGAGRRIKDPILQDWNVSDRFRVGFSRAVRSLIERGELVRLLPSVKEVRFVSRSEAAV